jgi:hypothetical protein
MEGFSSRNTPPDGDQSESTNLWITDQYKLAFRNKESDIV